MKIGSYSGKTAFITGGSSGIGLAIAKSFYSQGAIVCLFARREEILERAVGEIHRLSVDPAPETRTGRVERFVLDVTDRDSVQRVMKTAVERVGAPDFVVNCAGRAFPNYFEKIPYSQFLESVEVHLHGTWHVVEALLPVLKTRGGCIVNTASLAGLIGLFGYTDYCASKFGVIGFSEALRSEMGRFGIAVSVLCPPDTDTPGFAVENTTKPLETRRISENVNLMSPESVAKELMRGLKKNKFIIIPGLDGKLTYLAKRLAPWLVDLVVQRQIGKTEVRGESKSESTNRTAGDEE